MPSITNNQGKQIREAMGSMKDKDQKRSYLYALLGYAPPTSSHKEKESKLEEKKEKVAGKMSPSDKYMKLTYGMMREGEGKRFFKSYSRHKRKISGNKYGIEKKDLYASWLMLKPRKQFEQVHGHPSPRGKNL